MVTDGRLQTAANGMSGKTWMMRLLMLGAVVAVVLNGSAHADYSQRADVRAYVAELVAEHGFAAEELNDLFARAERKQSILDAIARPAERTLKWHEYRDIFIEEPRIAQGLEFWNDHEAVLAQAEAQFGVAPEYVVAILGVETRYGRITGGYRVLDALVTLGFDYPPRADFFRRELTQFLLLAREEGHNPLTLTGSYAGAMGYGQFIPSSFRSFAVDFDGDGLRDIWSNPEDAVGSIANYFERHGWRAGEDVVLQVEVDGDRAAGIANATLDLTHTVAELERLGVAVDGLPGEAPAALFMMEGEHGQEYWLGLNNFHVITRYNRSRLYALAVHQLGQHIKSRRQALMVER
jgi:membrane-bound lytic murein transglycosylase B